MSIKENIDSNCIIEIINIFIRDITRVDKLEMPLLFGVETSGCEPLIK